MLQKLLDHGHTQGRGKGVRDGQISRDRESSNSRTGWLERSNKALLGSIDENTDCKILLYQWSPVHYDCYARCDQDPLGRKAWHAELGDTAYQRLFSLTSDYGTELPAQMHTDGNVKFQIEPDLLNANVSLHLVTLCSSFTPDVM
ncbi:hypothetical protein FHL15_006694 [Xylaria flabelliformis]|uniref:Uncharacterized protein n=1 Tax=Xylaria flabelliformis TaxID=2512241 RepID=A0A553HX62_9PEZI|nr:hypothetical protein FHL15_006694 [Xylaria flabelliformis]